MRQFSLILVILTVLFSKWFADGAYQPNSQGLGTPGDSTTLLETVSRIPVLRLAKHKVLYKIVPIIPHRS